MVSIIDQNNANYARIEMRYFIHFHTKQGYHLQCLCLNTASKYLYKISFAYGLNSIEFKLNL
jgi:hypothetical protein